MYYVWIPQGFNIEVGKKQWWCKRIWTKVEKKTHFTSRIMQKFVPYLKVKICAIQWLFFMHYPWQKWIMWQLHFQGSKWPTKWLLGLDNCMLPSLIWEHMVMVMRDMNSILMGCGLMGWVLVLTILNFGKNSNLRVKNIFGTHFTKHDLLLHL